MSTSEGNAEYVTVEEVAGLLHRTDRSVRKLLNARKLRGVNPTGRKWLIPRSEMQRFLGAAPLEPGQDMRSAIGQAHYQELGYFGQRLRDRLSPYGVKELVQLGAEVKQGELWAGRPEAFLSDHPTDPLERKVEEEWGALRYDAREHYLFEDFCQHLAGHPCWPALEQVEVSFQAQQKAWQQGYAKILNRANKKLAELKRSDIDAQPIANSLMAHAYEEGKLEFSYEPDKSNQRGRDYWYLKLGAWHVGREEDPEGLKPIIEVHRALNERVLSWKAIQIFQQRHADAWGKVEEFQKYLGSDAQLRKLLLESRCESCP